MGMLKKHRYSNFSAFELKKKTVVTFLRLSLRILMWVNQTFHNHKVSFFDFVLNYNSMRDKNKSTL